MVTAANLFNVIAVFVIGACFGSFATALIHRLPLHKSWFLDKGVSRSCCPSCGHILSAKDLIPVLSWLSTLGRCRYCQKSIPVFYPITELSVGLMAAALYILLGDETGAIPILLALPFLVVLIETNIRTGKNFVMLSAAIFLLGAVSGLMGADWFSTISAALILPLIMGVCAFVSFGSSALKNMLWGEAFFFAGVGFFIGVGGMPLYLLLMPTLIAFSVIFCVFTKRKRINFFPTIYALALIFHFFLTGLGFDGRAVY